MESLMIDSKDILSSSEILGDKQLWWEEESKWEVRPTKYCSVQLFVRSLQTNNSFGSFSQKNKNVELTSISSLWFLFTKIWKY